MNRLSEQGSMLPMFGGLIFVAFIVIALAMELSLLGQDYRSAAAVADAASEAGASVISERSAYDSVIAVDVDRAYEESQSVGQSLAPTGFSLDTTATASDVCVTVRSVYEPTTLVFIGVDAIDIAVTSCAEPRTG